MSQLCVHAGGRHVSYDELCAVETPAALGPRHMPWPYHEFINVVLDKLKHYGLTPVSHQYALAKENKQFFGVIELESETKGYAPVLGLRGSHDQSLARGMSLGSRTFVCDNLAFSSDFVVKAMQTTNVAKRVPRLLDGVIGKMTALIEDQDAVIKGMQTTTMKKITPDAFFTQLLRTQTVPPTRILDVIHEWDHPKHEEHMIDGGLRSLWTMYNAVTEVLKPDETTSARAFDTLRSRTLRLHRLLHGALINEGWVAPRPVIEHEVLAA